MVAMAGLDVEIYLNTEDETIRETYDAIATRSWEIRQLLQHNLAVMTANFLGKVLGAK